MLVVHEAKLTAAGTNANPNDKCLTAGAFYSGKAIALRDLRRVEQRTGFQSGERIRKGQWRQALNGAKREHFTTT